MPGRLETALAATGYSFAHHGWSHAPAGDYGVWSEESGRDLVANGRHIETGTRVYVHLFTRDATKAPRVAVETQLNTLREPWSLNTIQYENSTGFIHYEWEVGLHGEA